MSSPSHLGLSFSSFVIHRACKHGRGGSCTHTSPDAACPDTRARVHQWYLHISNYFEEDAKWSVASVQWTDLPFIFVASFLRSPFSSAPATASFPSHYPFFRRRFAFVLSHKYMSAHRCRGIDPSILSQLHSPVSPVSKELTGGVSPWQTEPIGKRSTSFLLFILLFSSNRRYQPGFF